MRRRAATIVLGVGLGTALLALAARPDDGVAPATTCVPGARPDPARTARISDALRNALGQLTSSADAARLASARWERSTFCYSDDSALHEPAQVVLDATLDDYEATARAAHLLLHAWVAPPWSVGTADAQPTCETRVHAALAAEMRARDLEHAVAAKLGTRAAPERTQTALAASYAERCRRERR